MKLFLAFMFDEMHGIGGPFDMRGRFESLEQAKSFLDNDRVFDTHSIVDASTGKIYLRKRLLGTDWWGEWRALKEEALSILGEMPPAIDSPPNGQRLMKLLENEKSPTSPEGPAG